MTLLDSFRSIVGSDVIYGNLVKYLSTSSLTMKTDYWPSGDGADR